MAEDDPKLWLGVEQARSHQSQRVNRGFLTKGPGRPHQPRMAFIDSRIFRQRIARMQIERKAGLFDLGPEWPILREVVIDRLPAVANLRKPVDQRAAEAERFD